MYKATRKGWRTVAITHKKTWELLKCIIPDFCPRITTQPLLKPVVVNIQDTRLEGHMKTKEEFKKAYEVKFYRFLVAE